MDWFPLYNSLRIAVISSVLVFFSGIFAAYYIAKLHPVIKGVLDVILTLPMVLPPDRSRIFYPAAVGFQKTIWTLVLSYFWNETGYELVFRYFCCYSGSLSTDVPYCAGAFESFDETYSWSGQTLGLSNGYIFWKIRMPACRQGIMAGAVLAFARALGEYGATSMVAGYTPGKTATISTTVYQLWRTNDDMLAFKWVMVNIAISAVVLLAVNMLEKKNMAGKRRTG